MDKRQRILKEIWCYPIKSCAGISLITAQVGTYGIENDRRYMVVDADTGMFVAQRQDKDLGIAVRSMCQIVPKFDNVGNIELSAPGMHDTVFYSSIMLDLPGRRRKVRIWNTESVGLIADADTNHWLTQFLSRERRGKYQLVAMQPALIRRAKRGYSQLDFADAYPFMMVSQESLDDLQQRIGGEPLPLSRRFRPNLVIGGGAAYEEDDIKRMVITGVDGGVDFEGQTLCERCPLPAIDQDTAIPGKEPLRTLAGYRRGEHLTQHAGLKPKPVYLGRNFNHLSFGTIRLGDTVEVSK